MDHTNAERQARWQARRKQKFQEMEQRIRDLEAQVSLRNGSRARSNATASRIPLSVIEDAVRPISNDTVILRSNRQ